MRALIRSRLLLLLSGPLVSSVVLAQSPGATPIAVQAVVPPATVSSATPPVDYAGAVWVPAAQGNFQAANRPQSSPVEMVVVHDIEGPDTAALGIFQRPGAKVSAHYVVGESGTIYQMVRERDIAWHAGNGDINARAIGIETHGFAYRPGFFSGTVYEAEAKLVRDITRRYNIPRDRTHIIGHAEVPNPRDPTRFGGANGHTDPGPYWDWNTFMALVRNDARLESAEVPSLIHPGETLSASVTLENTGDDLWTANKAKDARQGLVADVPVIYLGTTHGTASAFSSFNGWVAPQYADVLKGADVASGTSARFEFTLQGPRTLGQINEVLRATRVPTANQGGLPVSFGDAVPLKVNVVPWDITIPVPDDFTAMRSESPAPLAGETTIKSSPVVVTPAITVSKTQSLARWTVKVPIGGIWGVYMAPPKPPKMRKNDIFSYTLSGMKEDKQVGISAKSAGRGFVLGGYYDFPEPSKNAPPITITLNKAPRGITAGNAGSLRLVGPFPTLPEKMDFLP